MKPTFFASLGLCALIQVAATPGGAADAVIVDHKCTDISKVPKEFIEKAKKDFKICYGHTSHGSQIVSGMEALRAAEPKLFAFGKGTGSNALDFVDKTPKGDLGNPDRKTWAERTREYLDGRGKDRNLVIWSWCGQVSKSSESDIEGYLEAMSSLEKDYPKVKFVYMTGHLDGSGKDGNLNKRNEQIREFCAKNGKTLFDFADIESFAPNGKTNYMELFAKDSCDYRGGNWADQWLEANPDSGIALPASAAHSRPLNAALKGRAFWWMLARLAGWSPQAEKTK
jgi:hypothetical protein